MDRVVFYGADRRPALWLDADNATERGGQILMVIGQFAGTIAARTYQDTVAITAGPHLGSLWADAGVESAGPGPAPAGSLERAFGTTARDTAAGALPGATVSRRSPLEQRLMGGAVLDLIVLGAVGGGNAESISRFLMNPAGLLVLGGILVAAAALPWWWSRLARMVGSRTVTGG